MVWSVFLLSKKSACLFFSSSIKMLLFFAFSFSTVSGRNIADISFSVMKGDKSVNGLSSCVSKTIHLGNIFIFVLRFLNLFLYVTF